MTGITLSIQMNLKARGVCSVPVLSEKVLGVANGRASNFRNARKVKPSVLECSGAQIFHKSRTVLLECSFSKRSQMLECLFISIN